MDALTVLRREHTRIEQLFIEFDSLAECACAGRKALVREIDAIVRRHIEMEEALIYGHIASAPEEHQHVLHLLEGIAQTECHDSIYVSRVRELRDVLRSHIREEEACIFPAYAGFAQVA